MAGATVSEPAWRPRLRPEVVLRHAATRGADVVIPAGVLPGLLIGREHGLKIGHAPVVNCAAIALKSAEMWVQLRELNGVEPSRGPSFRRASAVARSDFRALLARNGR